MTRNISRIRWIAMAMAALLLGAGLFFSPRLVQRVYAQESTCSATCDNGSCTASGSNCTCTCSFWTGTPQCSCIDQT